MSPRSEGYFGPESTIRTLGSEAVLMLGGGRALLMQAAHPLVAAGIVGHSRYRKEPWRRLARTMVALYGRPRHPRRGRSTRIGRRRRSPLREGRSLLSARPYPAGRRYSVLDLRCRCGVHATLVDTGLVMYEFVGHLAEYERERFYADTKVVAEGFGVPSAAIPRTLSEFRDHMRGAPQAAR